MPQSIYKKKGLSKLEYINLLKDLYFNKKKTQREISNILDIHPATVELHFKKFGIVGRSRVEQARLLSKNYKMNLRQEQIFNGLMLSDGHLDASGSTISSRLTFGFKYEETVNDIKKELNCFNFSPTWRSEKTGCYHSKSNYYSNLREVWSKWYPNGVKIVPRNLDLSPLTCLYWFMGDGCGSDYAFILSTDSFSKEDNEFLMSKLKKIGFYTSLNSSNRIRIKSQSTNKFVNWIQSEKIILSHYSYKLDYRRVKNG